MNIENARDFGHLLLLEEGAHGVAVADLRIREGEQLYAVGPVLLSDQPPSQISEVAIEIERDVWRTVERHLHELGLRPPVVEQFFAANAFDGNIDTLVASIEEPDAERRFYIGSVQSPPSPVSISV